MKRRKIKTGEPAPVILDDQIQAVLKVEDFRPASEIRELIGKALAEGFRPSPKKRKPWMKRKPVRVTHQTREKLQNLARENGLRETELVRQMLGLDY